jgi:hypothetical protein
VRSATEGFPLLRLKENPGSDLVAYEAAILTAAAVRSVP